MKKKASSYSSKEFFLLAGIFLAGLWYRLPLLNRPFWVDEFSTAIQAQLVNLYGLNVFTQTEYYFEYHNITTHALVAVFFKLFGLTETSARLPIVIFGAVVPVLGYLLAKKLTNKLTGFIASLFLITSYFQIAWSQQARGYMIQQFLLLGSLLLYLDIIQSKKLSIRKVLTLMGILLLGLLTHITFILVIGSFLLHALWIYRNSLQKILAKPILIVLAVIGLGLALIISGAGYQIYLFIKQFLSSGLINNLWYYHSFLWRQQTLITFLGAIGLVLLSFKKPKTSTVIGVLLISYLFFFVFLFPPYVSRYLLPIFPLLVIGMSHAVVEIAGLVPLNKSIVALGITVCIIANGNTFVLKPKPFYSPNTFMREIPLLDYDQVYQPIIETIERSDEPVAVIDPWLDRAKWYVGLNYPDLFVFRWDEDPATTNGLARVTPHTIDDQGRKRLPLTGPQQAILVSEIDDILVIRAEYTKGYIWIDDQTLPADVIEYAKANFQQVITLDRYPLDDNPLSRWPGTLYYWSNDD